MESKLTESLSLLDSQEKVLFSMSHHLVATDVDMYPLDIFSIGVINRSLSLIDGFTQLICSDNYISAAHLVRPHLDNFLRFYAVWLVENPHEFSMNVMKGERIDTMLDRDGKKLKDSYLVKKASEVYPWMANVYSVSSGFVHFSSKHVFTSTIARDKEKGIVEFKVSTKDKYVPVESKIEATDCMTEITKCIVKLLEGWIWSKNNPDELEKLRKMIRG